VTFPGIHGVRCPLFVAPPAIRHKTFISQRQLSLG
jgi:hypothetical protein